MAQVSLQETIAFNTWMSRIVLGLCPVYFVLAALLLVVDALPSGREWVAILVFVLGTASSVVGWFVLSRNARRLAREGLPKDPVPPAVGWENITFVVGSLCIFFVMGYVFSVLAAEKHQERVLLSALVESVAAPNEED